MRMPTAIAGLVAGSTLALASPPPNPRSSASTTSCASRAWTDLDLSPDGEYVVYSVGEPNFKADEPRYDLWRARWDGSDKHPLTRTAGRRRIPAGLQPGRPRIAFLSDRGDEDAETQVWVMPADARRGGAAHGFPGRRLGLRLVAGRKDARRDRERSRAPRGRRETAAAAADRDRPLLLQGGLHGLPVRQARTLWLFDVASRKATQLTRAQHDERLPAWSPDGKRIAYVTKRGPDPDRHLNSDIYVIEAREGAAEKQVTRFEGADNDADLESPLAWSPDGRKIAYTQAGEDKWIYYKPWSLAIVDVESGAVTRPAGTELDHTKPVFTPDGKAVLVLVEESRVTHVSRIDLATGQVTPLTSGPRFDFDFAVAANGRVAVLGGDDLHPYRIEAVEPKGTAGRRRTQRVAEGPQARAGRGDQLQERGRHLDRRLPREAGGLRRRGSATRRSCASTAGPCTSSATSSWRTGRSTPRTAMPWSRPIRAAAQAAASSSRRRSMRTGATRTGPT